MKGKVYKHLVSFGFNVETLNLLNDANLLRLAADYNYNF